MSAGFARFTTAARLDSIVDGRIGGAQVMAFLQITSPEGTERTVELADHNTLGRHPDNTIQLLDRIVSKTHCHIDLVDGKHTLIDQGSLNGTYVNGERVQGTRVLRQDDEISLGSTKIVFYGSKAAVPPEPSKPPGTPNFGVTAVAGVPGRVTMSP